MMVTREPVIILGRESNAVLISSDKRAEYLRCDIFHHRIQCRGRSQ